MGTAPSCKPPARLRPSWETDAPASDERSGLARPKEAAQTPYGTTFSSRVTTIRVGPRLSVQRLSPDRTSGGAVDGVELDVARCASDTHIPKLTQHIAHSRRAFRLCGVLLLCASRPVHPWVRLEPKVVTPPMHQGACATRVLRCRDTRESAVWERHLIERPLP